MGSKIQNWWKGFCERRPELSKFLMFFLLSNGVTVLQLAMMPVARAILGTTDLVNTTFQVLPVGSNVDGSQYYIFDYAAGALPAGGGGLAYFIAVQLTLLVAQIINFFLQRSITFKSTSNVWVAAFWYLIAYVAITFIAAAAQGFYKAPIYSLSADLFGAGGTTVADVVTMIINSAISFWVFYPIFKVIFKDGKQPAESATETNILK